MFSKHQEEFYMITVSEKAVAKLNELKQQSTSGQDVRILFKGFGWGGPSLGWVLDEPTERDKIQEIKGIRFIFDMDTWYRLQPFFPLTIDYNEHSWFGGIRVKISRPGGLSPSSCR